MNLGVLFGSTLILALNPLTNSWIIYKKNFSFMGFSDSIFSHKNSLNQFLK